MKARALAALAAVVASGPAPALAQKGDVKKVALAPLSTLGEEAKSAEVHRVEQLVLEGIGKIPATSVMPMKQLLSEVKQAKRDDLRNCDGDVACQTDLGALLSADYVVYGEVGGVGEVQIAYLKLVDVAGKRELRSTTLEIAGEGPDKAAHAAAMRLLVPSRYVGTLELRVDVGGASIYVDGKLTSKSPSRPLSLAVGTHAVRVTHPEYRDFVRFVDVTFETAQTLDVGLQQYPIVASDMRRTEKPRAPVAPVQDEGPTPWYRRWYTIAGGGVVVLVGTAVVFAVLTSGVDADQETTVE